LAKAVVNEVQWLRISRLSWSWWGPNPILARDGFFSCANCPKHRMTSIYQLVDQNSPTTKEQIKLHQQTRANRERRWVTAL
jgi:hypothetical protein